ncbi:hypothetical protein J0676_27620, partial [Vibrio sp. Vb2880]|uniref:hypothetical protein n=1 Tax=Vibrio sp. Vb2880 TaxID=2816076 RepID=UPI001A8E19A8
MASVEAFLSQNAPHTPTVARNGFFFTDDDLAAAKLNEGLPFVITPAYDTAGNANFLGSNGDLDAGI